MQTGLHLYYFMYRKATGSNRALSTWNTGVVPAVYDERRVYYIDRLVFYISPQIKSCYIQSVFWIVKCLYTSLGNMQPRWRTTIKHTSVRVKTWIVTRHCCGGNRNYEFIVAHFTFWNCKVVHLTWFSDFWKYLTWMCHHLYVCDAQMKMMNIYKA